MLIRIVKNNGLYQVLSILTALIVQILFVYLWGQNLEKEEIGYISIVSVLTSFGLIFSNLGITNYILYKRKIYKKQLEVMNNIMLFVSLVIFMFVISFGFVSDYFLDIDIKNSLLIVAFIFPFIGLSITSQALLVKKKLLNTIAKIEIVSKISALMFFYLSLKITKNSEVYFLSQLIMWGVKSGGFLIVSRKFNHFNLKNLKIRLVSDFAPYLKALVFGQLLNTCSQKVDEVVLALVFSFEQLGIYYSFKQLAVQLSAMYFNLIRRIFLPYIAEINGKKLYSKVYNITTVIYTVALVVVLITYNISFSLVFNVEVTEFNKHLFLLAFVAVYLKYLSANVQTAYYQVIGKPLKELNWNVIQVLILVLPVTLLVSFSIISNVEFITIQIVFSYILFFVSSFFFENKKNEINTFVVILPSVITILLFIS